MKRIFYLFLAISLMFTQPVFGVAQWREDGSEETIDGGESPSDIDTESYNNIVQPLDRLLAGYREGCEIIWASTSTLTVGDGEVVVSNTAGTARLMLRNTSNTTVTWSDIDTGAEAASTTYYVYAGTSTTSDLTFTVYISTSSTTPSSVTYYKRLGSFFNNASSNILNDETLTNDSNYYALQLGDWVNKAFDVSYEALTDGFVVSTVAGGSGTVIATYTDSSDPPTTLRTKISGGNGASCCPVKKGDYWETTITSPGGTRSVYWIPNE